MAKFEVGKKYFMFSACDSNCTWTYKVISRTAKTITLQDDYANSITQRFRITEHDNTEMVYPLGKYSMCPVLKATRQVKPILAPQVDSFISKEVF